MATVLFGNFKAWWRKYGANKVDGVYPIIDEKYLGEFEVPTGKSAHDFIVEQIGPAPSGFTLDFQMNHPK